MNSAIKVFALGVALAASATMARADDSFSVSSGTSPNTATLEYQLNAAETSGYLNVLSNGVVHAGSENFQSGDLFATYIADNDVVDYDLNDISFNVGTGEAGGPTEIFTVYGTANGGDDFNFWINHYNAAVSDNGTQQSLSFSGDGYWVDSFGNTFSGDFDLNTASGTKDDGTWTGTLSFSGDAIGVPPAAPTPEPSSLLLLGSGLLGAAGIARRRFLSRHSA